MDQPRNFGGALDGDHLAKAIVARLAAVASLASMSALAKVASNGGAHITEILFFRQVVGLPLILVAAMLGPGVASLRSDRIGSHVLRSIVGLASISTWIWAVTLLPLAEASAIQFAVPLSATVAGALLLREHLDWRRWLAVIIGFGGILLVARPAATNFGWEAVTVGGSNVILAGLVAVVLRRIGRTEPPLTTVFWFVALSSIPLSIAFALDHRAHPMGVWMVLVGVGITGSLAQLAITTSLRHGQIALVMPIDYTMLLCATLYGWVLFDAIPDGRTWLGAFIIAASTLYPLWRERHGSRLRRASSVFPPQ